MRVSEMALPRGIGEGVAMGTVAEEPEIEGQAADPEGIV